MVIRLLQDKIIKDLNTGKAIVIYGARQVGKTTLVKSIVSQLAEKTLFLNGDEASVRNFFASFSSDRFRLIAGDNKIIVIDEAQRIPDAGLAIKIIHDNFPDIRLIVTGSSPLELSDRIKEPLTGRKFEYKLHPFSFEEMVNHHGFLHEKNLLEDRLIYGSYPEVALATHDKQRLLKVLSSDYLYKDLLILEDIRKPALLEKILKALALQLGNEVSVNELALLVGSDRTTVEKYLDLLEKSYIIFRLGGLSRNVRNEIKKAKKIYFFDNGIRNAIIGNFLPPDSRNDIGALWENYLMSERNKYLSLRMTDAIPYFWRTTQQQEIDYIEEAESVLSAYEFKWKPRKKITPSKTFLRAYPGSSFKVISPENIDEFLL
jgi:predicted AAA+ superfamily ATPase